MVREDKIEKIIKQAIDQCDSSLKEVKLLLIKATKELHKKKKNKNKEKDLTPFQKWQLDISSGTLKNLSLDQKNKIINKIEGMISDEGLKLKKEFDELINE